MVSVLFMVTRDEILVELYNTQFVENYAKKFVKGNDIEFLEDEIQELYLIAAEIPEERIISMYRADGINGVRRFMAGVIHRQMNSTTSLIHSKYRKHKINTFTTDGMSVEDIEAAANKLDNEYKG